MTGNENLIAHELTHVGQNKGRGFFGNVIARLQESVANPYKERPSEIEAYAAETRKFPEDIELPAERYGSPITGR